MRRNARIGMATALAAGLLTGLLGSAPAAFAGGKAGDVTTSGSCSAASTWKVTVKPDNGRLETQFEVDSNVSGQTWRVRLDDNGTVYFRGTAVTGGTSGSFEVKRFTADQAGTDTITGRAKNVSTGETCVGSATL
jgi:hypothetical protein